MDILEVLDVKVAATCGQLSGSRQSRHPREDRMRIAYFRMPQLIRTIVFVLQYRISEFGSPWPGVIASDKPVSTEYAKKNRLLKSGCTKYLNDRPE